MSRLGQLQEEFQRAVLTRSDGFNREVVDSGRIGPARRVEIYADAYRGRLVDCLADSYEAMHSLLGDEQFYRLAHRYIDAHPPRHYSIRWYGDQLAAFARRTAPYSEHPYIAELADFQWQLLTAFDAADVAPLTADAVARVPADAWPCLRLRFHPSLRRLMLQWNVPAIWRQIDAGADRPEAPRRSEQPRPWIIWRSELMQRFRSLGADEAWALDHAREGASFAALCEGLCDWHAETEVAGRTAAMLKQWVGDGMVVGLATD
jgi:hypothetical protein